MRTIRGPQDHAEQYAKSSAFLPSGGLRDYVPSIHGIRDYTVLFKDSITPAQRRLLQRNGVDLVVLPGGAQGWDTVGVAQTRFAFRKLAEYFRRNLGEGSSQQQCE